MRKDKIRLKLIKLLKGALIAALGAGLTYAAEGVQGVDLGELTPVVVALLSVAVNAVRQIAFKSTDDFETGYVCGYVDKEVVGEGIRDDSLSN